MMRKAKLFAAGVILSASVVSGCTNSRDDTNAATLAKGFWQSFQAGRKDPVPTDPALIRSATASALSQTDGPLALIRFDKTKSTALLRQIESNGPYRTWSTYGTTERRSITSRDGVVTATRGLGGDLMSSSVNGLLKMVTERQDGIAQQVLRHLDGENVIAETEAYCAFTPGEQEQYRQGAISQRVTRIDAFCKTDTGSFSNYYLVDGSGRILESRQWLGPDLGYGTMKRIQ